MEIFRHKVNETAHKLAEYTNKHVDPDLGITNKLIFDFGLELAQTCVYNNHGSELFARDGDIGNVRFKGVYNIDDLFSHLSSASWIDDAFFSFIINLGREEDKYPSGHFVTCILDKKKLSYIDSFGFPPPLDNQTLTKCLKFIQDRNPLQDTEIYYNKTAIQHISSMSCGLFALSFILLNELRMNEKKLTWYKFDLVKNDDRVKDNLLRLIKKCYKKK